MINCSICQSEDHITTQHASLLLCIYCSKSRYKHRRCQEHYEAEIDKFRSQHRLHAKVAYEKGICWRCGKVKDTEVGWYCNDCRLITNAQKREATAKKRFCKLCQEPGHSHVSHKSLGKCNECSKEKFKDGKCKFHFLVSRQKYSAAQIVYKNKKLSSGLCYRCSNKKLPDKIYCGICLEKRKQYVAKYD